MLESVSAPRVIKADIIELQTSLQCIKSRVTVYVYPHDCMVLHLILNTSGLLP